MTELPRKPPADLEPDFSAPGVDPFRYGWRPRYVRLPSGEVMEQRIPLTPEDLLDPQPGDVLVESWLHGDFSNIFYEMLKEHFEDQDDVLVTFDVKMLWGIPGLSNPAPDLSIIRGLRRKIDPTRTAFDVIREGVRPSLILEVVSTSDPEARNNDYEAKVEIYQRARIPEYFILEPPQPVNGERLLLTGYRLGPDDRYHRIVPDTDGPLLSDSTRLLFGIGEDGRTLRIIDVVTGEQLLTRKELRAELNRLKSSE